MDDKTTAQSLPSSGTVYAPGQASNTPPPSAPPVAPTYYPEDGGSSKKKLLFIIGGIVIFLLLVFGIAQFLMSRGEGGNEQVKLTYWAVWEDEQIFSEVISGFEREHPNIDIDYKKQDIKSLGDYIARLTTQINNGNGPDVYRFHNSWVPQLQGYLLPLPKDVVEAAELDTQYYKVVQNDLRVGGAYYGIPLQMDTIALFVNTELFQAAGKPYPTTWTEVLDLAPSLTVKDEATGKITTSGVALGTYDNIAHASDIISLLLVQNGADLKDLNGRTKRNSADALSYYTSFAKGEGKVWDESMDNSKLAFTKGNLAMYLGYSWDILEIKAANPNLQFEVLGVPRLSSRNESIASYWVEGVSSKSRNPKAAYEFLQYLSRKDVMEKLYAKQAQLRGFGELYPRRDLASKITSNKMLAPFVVQADNAVSTPFSSDTYDDAMNASLNGYLGNAVRSMLSNNTSAESAIETLSKGVAQGLGQDASTE